MSDFKDLVAKLNAISNNEQIVSGNGDEVYKPVEEAVAGTKQTASILKAFNEIEGERVAEAKAKAEDIESSIHSRYADFLKSEVAQGNDLASVTTAVEEGSSQATDISDSFDKMFNMMERLMKVTGEGAVLTQMVEREGGEISYVQEAHQKLIEAMEALETANMYAQRIPDED